jgi:hypothetical protein
MLSLGIEIFPRSSGKYSSLGSFGGSQWLLYGVWGDTIPTSDAWTVAASWFVEGVWQDSVPVGIVTWSSPDGTSFVIWEDTEATV